MYIISWLVVVNVVHMSETPHALSLCVSFLIYLPHQFMCTIALHAHAHGMKKRVVVKVYSFSRRCSKMNLHIFTKNRCPHNSRAQLNAPLHAHAQGMKKCVPAHFQKEFKDEFASFQ